MPQRGQALSRSQKVGIAFSPNHKSLALPSIFFQSQNDGIAWIFSPRFQKGVCELDRGLGSGDDDNEAAAGLGKVGAQPLAQPRAPTRRGGDEHRGGWGMRNLGRWDLEVIPRNGPNL